MNTVYNIVYNRCAEFLNQLAVWYRTNPLVWQDWLIIFVYIAFALGVGAWFIRRSGKSMTDYYVSGRSLPWWLLGTSMIATSFAADTPLAITSYIRTKGVYANWMWMGLAVGQLLAVFSFSLFWRRSEVITDNQLIEMRYTGRPAAALRGFKAALFATVYNFIVLGWVLTAIGDVSEIIIGIPKVPAIIIFSVITLLYCTAGGLWAVAVTDLVQFGISMLGMIVLAFFAVKSIGGLDVLRASVADNPHMNFFPPAGEGAFRFGAPMFDFLMFILVGWWATPSADGGGYLIQRMAAAKDERHSRLGMLWFVIGTYAVRLWPWIIVAAVSLVLYPAAITPDVSPLGEKAAFPLVMRDVLKHPGLLGLMVTVFVAAFMSTIDTHLNWGSSYIINDIYRRFFVKDASERHYVKVSYVANVVILAVAGVVAVYIHTIEAAWEFIRAMGAGIGVILILRWFYWRINAWTEIAALAASLGVTAFFEIAAVYQHGHAYRLFSTPATFFGVTWTFAAKMFVIIPVSLVAAHVATFLTAPVPRKTLIEFFRKVRPSGIWGSIPDEAGVKPAGLNARGVVGWLSSVAFLYTLTFGIGKVIFGPVWLGWALLAAAAAFGWVVFEAMKERPNAGK